MIYLYIIYFVYIKRFKKEAEFYNLSLFCLNGEILYERFRFIIS